MLNRAMNHSFYQDQQATIPNDLIFDQIYKNASSKNKYSRNPKYIYYNALLNMKQKLKEHQGPVFNNLFTNPPRKEPSTSHIQHEASPRKTLMPIYHVQKINKMKFKVYKQGVTHFVQKLPVTDLSFQIKIKGDADAQLLNHNKPRLEQILSQYRKMNSSHRHSENRGELRRSSLSHVGNLDVKWMRNTMSKIGRSATTHRK